MSFILCGGYFGLLASQINTEYSLAQFQPTDDPMVDAEDQMAERYLLQTTSPYVISLTLPENQSWVDEPNLALLDQVTEPLFEIENIVEVVSLNTAPLSVVTDNQLSVGTAADIKNKKELMENEFLVPNLLSKDGLKTVIFIQPELISAQQQKILFKQIRDITSQLPNQVTTKIGGPAAASTSMSTLLEKEILFFSLTSLLLAACLLFLVFRGFWTPILCLGVTALANVFAIGSISLIGLSFSLLSNTLPVITTITTLALMIHSLMKLQEMAEVQNPIQRTFDELFEPHFLTALTTLIGFATLIPSKVPIISEFGLSVCIGVTTATIVSLLFFPCMLAKIKNPKSRDLSFAQINFFQWIFSYRKPITLVVVLCSGLLFFKGQDLNWSSQVFDDLPRDHEVLHNTLYIDENHGGSIALHLSVGYEQAEAYWKEPENLRKLNLLHQQILKFQGVGSVTSLNDFVKSSDPNKQLPTDSKSLSEIYFIYGMSSDNPLDQFVTPNRKHTRVAIRMRDIPSDRLLASNQKIFEKAEEIFPGAQVSIAGPAESIHKINKRLSNELIFGFFHALFWILLVLAVIYRSLTLALFSAIPNLIPPSFLLGTLALTGISIKPGIAIIFAISLGIAFDNTVYLLSKLKRNGIKTWPQIHQVFQIESGACFLSSLILAFGFAIFLFSNFSMNIMFGSFMLVSIFSGLVGDLVLLPAILAWKPQLLSFSFSRGILFNIKRSRIMKLSLSKVFTSLTILMLVTFFYQNSQAASTPAAQKILKSVQKNNIVPNELIEMQMVINERDGSKKVRELIIKKKNGNKKMSLVKLNKPSDLKGVGLLSVSDNDDNESQWLFLPSEKRSRRLASSSKGGNFLDSDLSYEDMSISTYQNFNNDVEKTVKSKKGREVVILKSMSKNKDDSSYGKIRTWIDAKTSQILKANYYDHKGKLVKKILFKNYKRFGKVWRAQNVIVSNLKKKRSTVLKIKKVSMKKLSAGELSMSALEEG